MNYLVECVLKSLGHRSYFKSDVEAAEMVAKGKIRYAESV